MEFLRDIQPDIPTANRFAFDFYRRLEQFAHVAPFAVWPDHSALKSIHIQKVVYDAIQSVGAVMNFAGQLFEYFGVPECLASGADSSWLAAPIAASGVFSSCDTQSSNVLRSRSDSCAT